MFSSPPVVDWKSKRGVRAGLHFMWNTLVLSQFRGVFGHNTSFL